MHVEVEIRKKLYFFFNKATWFGRAKLKLAPQLRIRLVLLLLLIFLLQN